MLLVLVALFVFLIDQGTKLLVRTSFGPGETVPLWNGIFHLTFVENPGAAFGILPYRQGFFITATVLVVAAIAFYYRQIPAEKKLLRIALGLEVGGALGNLLDRIRFGHVTDFFDFRMIDWPVFNLADTAVVIGALLILWDLLGLRGGSTQESEPGV